MTSLLGGVADACIANRCALLGGETAEMPGFYQPGDYELVGFIVGVVERGRILDGSAVRSGDALIGLASAGLHTNGFSLARRAFFDLAGFGLLSRLPASERTVQDVLLGPHLSYLSVLEPFLGDPRLHALAHITGGQVAIGHDALAVKTFALDDLPPLPFPHDERILKDRKQKG